METIMEPTFATPLEKELYEALEDLAKWADGIHMSVLEEGKLRKAKAILKKAKGKAA